MTVDRSDSATGWIVELSTGPTERFHARDLPDVIRPTVWVHHPTAPAAVLGSTQDHSLLELSAAPENLEVCKRRSGGGLVVIEPDRSLWIDVLIPRSCALWDDDINRSFDWLGSVWSQALGDLGALRPQPHRGPLTNRAHGAVICFAGLGPGEVTVESADGRRSKVVGLSQRRTRQGARFQCLAVFGWSPELLESLVSPKSLPADLHISELMIGLGQAEAMGAQDLVDRFLSHLPALSS